MKDNLRAHLFALLDDLRKLQRSSSDPHLNERTRRAGIYSGLGAYTEALMMARRRLADILDELESKV